MGVAFPLFVYGTLRRGEVNHGRLAGRYRQVRPARAAGIVTVRGTPYLSVPPGSILARGSTDGEADAFAAARASAGGNLRIAPGPLVEGELYLLADPAADLPELDAFEDYLPETPERSDYLRSLLPVRCGGRVAAAWAYVDPASAGG